MEGEFARPDSIRALLRSTPGFNKPEGAQRQDLSAVLVADPDNPHDPHAVAVYLENHHVGYLSRHEARRFGPAIGKAAAAGGSFAVPGRIWGTKNTYTSADVVGQVNIYLPDPALMLPETELPAEGYVLLPGRHTIQVTKEEEHHDVLIRHVRPDPGKPVAVELVVVEEKRPRSSVTLVQVELDGERVGVLTPTMTKQLQPIIEHLEQMHLRTFARAVVFGSSLKAEVTLNTIKATDGDVDEWLHKVDLEHDSANQFGIADDERG
ncbi:HIRAN domain-containing protein [Ornithinimicrobium sufpigmenti]|uniref:HIRAN domain-containing protein n=1 Tax=Ornithinimicrobium sufpigmenti TaxID=2508882 RepID=UPI0015E19E71|nr:MULTISPECIES: HIRAN domain-containing protein [unclassified Ornithinimicrobium]